LDSQFRCKCGKQMAYSNEACKDCGSLGPHSYAGQAGPPAVTTQGPPQQGRSGNIPVDRGERQPPAMAGREGPVNFEPVDDGSPRRGRGHHGDDDSRFPVGINRRAEILDHIEDMDREDTKGPAKRQKKAKERDDDGDWDRGERQGRERHFESFLDDGEGEEKPPKRRSGGIAATAISIILVIALILGAVYVYNNFDEVSGWLMTPAGPQTVRPAEQPTSPAGSETTPADPGRNPFAGLLAALGWGKTPAVPSENASPPAATSNQTAPEAPVKPAVPTDTTLPVISEILIKSITNYGAVITWKTDEPCTGRVSYKTEVGERNNSNGAVTPSRYHQVDLSGLESGKTYYITITCRDAAGNESKQDRTFQTLLSAADTTAPQLVGQPSASADDSSVTISWKTDEVAKSQIKYGLGSGYEFPSAFTNDFRSDHSIYLSGLSPNTTYYYQLVSRDASGNEMISPEGLRFKTEPETGASPYMGSKAPNFTLKNLKGEDVSLNQLRGKKVILNFWASWCTPCKIELPHFQTVWDKYGPDAGFTILTVAGSQSEETAIRSYIANGNYTFPVCLDPGEEAFNRYELTSIPKTYFIDKDGVIKRIQQGMFTGPGEIEFMLNSY
jgi:peroxiredoxin